jgi:hypothetical protein
MSTEKKQWRFKTEEEFIKEFKNEFPHEHPWTRFMNYLFGMPLTDEQANDPYRYHLLHPEACPHNQPKWPLRTHFFTTDPLPEGYNFPHAKHEWRVKHGYAKEGKAQAVPLPLIEGAPQEGI